MIRDGKFFIDIDYAAQCEKDRKISGEVMLVRRAGSRFIAVMACGYGSGVRSHVNAGVVASMLMNYTAAELPREQAAATVIRTFGSASSDEVSVGFCVADINSNGKIKTMEYGNASFILLRGSDHLPVDRKSLAIAGESIFATDFTVRAEDRIIMISQGVLDSGHLTHRLPEGWTEEGLLYFCMEKIRVDPVVSATGLSADIISTAVSNDLFSARNDMSCIVAYFRNPRKLLICTGPPYNERKDRILADMLENYSGKKLICGGTTGRIISRELARELNVVLKRDPAGLPAVSYMEGVEMVTEGVLTLTKTKNLLEKLDTSVVTGAGTDRTLARLLLDSDIIEFVVGTRINPVHQDPELPIELELRRNLVRDLKKILEEKFLKQVKVQYI